MKETKDGVSGTALTTGSGPDRTAPPGQPGPEAIRELKTELKKSRRRFKTIFDNAIEGIFRTDGRGRFIEANPSLAKLHGYASPQEFMDAITDLTRQLFVHPVDHKRLMRLIDESDSVQHFEAEMYKKDGSTYWVTMNIMVFRDKQGRPVRYEGTMLDISKRKKMEVAFRESEERYRVAIENSNDGVSIIENGILWYVNQRYIDLFGYDNAKELIGKSVEATIHPDDLTRVMDIINRRPGGTNVPSRYEFKGITKTGNTIFVEVSASAITFQGKPFYLVYLRDISERKEAEAALMKSHQALENLNRAKTKAVHHISHELKTPLSVIQGNIRILKRKLSQDPLYPALERIIEALERNMARLFDISRETDEIVRATHELEAGILLNDLDRLLKRMEDLSEIPAAIRDHWRAVKSWVAESLAVEAPDPTPVDPFTTVSMVVDEVKGNIPHRALDLEAHGHTGSIVHISAVILRSVILSLLKNAVENTPDYGMITVTVATNEKGTRILVSDRGIGITPEDQVFLLDGLYHTEETDQYSTKRPYDFGAGGKGLDLLRIKSYAQRYGFTLTLESDRCSHLTDTDAGCPGDIRRCAFCESPADCAVSGGTTFTILFTTNKAGYNTDVR